MPSRKIRDFLSPDVQRKLLEQGNEDVDYLMQQPLGMLELPIRLLNLLENNSLYVMRTIGELLERTTEELQQIPQLGKTSITLIAQSVDQFFKATLFPDCSPGGKVYSAETLYQLCMEQNLIGPYAWWDHYRL